VKKILYKITDSQYVSQFYLIIYIKEKGGFSYAKYNS